MKTSNSLNSSNSLSGIVYNEQIVDTYELVQKLLIETGGQAKLPYFLENNLPLIVGDPDFIKSQLSLFLISSFDKIKGQLGYVILSFQKDSKSWIFKFTLINKRFDSLDIFDHEKINASREFKLNFPKAARLYRKDSPAAIIYL